MMYRKGKWQMKKIWILVLWACLGSIALAFGAALAIDAVPEARFGVSPTGEFRWYLVTFALYVAVPFSIAQWVGLLLALPARNLQKLLTSVLWLPATCAGVLAMLLPMWWWSAGMFMDMPLGVAIPILPGAAILGACQALILRLLVGNGRYWIMSTLLGAAFGGVFGLMIAANFGNVLEVTWALITGLGIASFQAPALLHNVMRSSTDTH